jgi:hypothetical protein
MAEGLSSAQANAYLNSLCRGSAYTPPAAVWVQLHTGAPGAAGTSNAAGNTTRKQSTFGTNAAAGVIANTASVDWTNVNTAETYSKFSAWDASTAGNFLFSGSVSGNAVAVGDNFSAAIGALTATVTPIAS